MSSLGDRMKGNYEARCQHKLIRRMPVIVRVDGKAFHTFTKGMQKPFSTELMDAMYDGAICAINQMQGFKLAYIQSDEASFLLTDYDELTTEGWFDYKQSKIETITASAFTAGFNSYFYDSDYRTHPAMFDARSFNIPVAEVSNYFVWRAKDWARNSLSMYCRSVFSHKELEFKSAEQQHEMLHDKGMNWTTDLNYRERNGRFISNSVVSDGVLPNFESVNVFIKSVAPEVFK